LTKRSHDKLPIQDGAKMSRVRFWPCLYFQRGKPGRCTTSASLQSFQGDKNLTNIHLWHTRLQCVTTGCSLDGVRESSQQSTLVLVQYHAYERVPLLIFDIFVWRVICLMRPTSLLV
jgi:hypothetical protein